MQEAAGNTRGLDDPGSDEQTTSQYSEQSSGPQWIQQHGKQEEAREAQHADVVAKHDGADTWAPPWNPPDGDGGRMWKAADVYALTGGAVGAEGGPYEQPEQPEAQPPELGKAPTTVRDWAMRLVDMKGVAKPQEFSGRQQDWSEWRFRFVAIAELMGINTNMEDAARQRNPIEKKQLNENLCIQGQLLYNVLVHLVGGKALTILRCVQSGNGYEAWRRICTEYEPATPVRYTSMLTGILSPSWTEQRPFAEQIFIWEKAIDMYEAASGQRVADDVRVATMLKYAPAPVKMFLKLTPPDTLENYVREAQRWYADILVAHAVLRPGRHGRGHPSADGRERIAGTGAHRAQGQGQRQR